MVNIYIGLSLVLLLFLTTSFLANGFWSWYFNRNRINYKRQLASRQKEEMAIRYGDTIALAKRLSRSKFGSKVSWTDYLGNWVAALDFWLCKMKLRRVRKNMLETDVVNNSEKFEMKG